MTALVEVEHLGRWNPQLLEGGLIMAIAVVVGGLALSWGGPFNTTAFAPTKSRGNLTGVHAPACAIRMLSRALSRSG